MKNLIGRKVKGFKFDDSEFSYSYVRSMDYHIGKEGIISSFSNLTKSFKVTFADYEYFDSWNYPSELIEQHLID